MRSFGKEIPKAKPLTQVDNISFALDPSKQYYINMKVFYTCSILLFFFPFLF